MASNSLGYEFLGPTQPVGFLILAIGIIFTGLILLIFRNASQDIDSSFDRKRKELTKKEQFKKISRLYPPNKQK